jgi:3-dehydroquinate dehydratase
MVNKEIKSKDIKRLLLRAYRRYKNGEITEAQAQKEVYLLNSILKAIEVTDLEDRLDKIEANLNNTTAYGNN